MIVNIRNNTVNEIDLKNDLNKLNEIKNAEIIKYKKRTPRHKLDIVLTDKTLESENQENNNEN